MEKLAGIIKDVFNDFDLNQYNDNLCLKDIPNWDSMNGINFIIELEKVFSISLEGIIFSGDNKISDVINVINSKKRS